MGGFNQSDEPHHIIEGFVPLRTTFQGIESDNRLRSYGLLCERYLDVTRILRGKTKDLQGYFSDVFAILRSFNMNFEKDPLIQNLEKIRENTLKVMREMKMFLSGLSETEDRIKMIMNALDLHIRGLMGRIETLKEKKKETAADLESESPSLEDLNYIIVIFKEINELCLKWNNLQKYKLKCQDLFLNQILNLIERTQLRLTILCNVIKILNYLINLDSASVLKTELTKFLDICRKYNI